jgi:2-methylcitrate dehydratase PrpD
LLLDGDVFVDQFSEDKVSDPERMRVAARVEVVEDPALTARGSVHRHAVRVEVFLRDGTHLQETVQTPRGSEHSFADAAQVIEKFTKLATRRIAPAHAARIVEHVLDAERMTSAGALAKLLATSES